MNGNAQVSEEAGRGRGRPRDEDARKRILNAALTLIEAYGYANVTMESISERAGASKATVYRWWPNKCAILIEAFREAVLPELSFPDTGSLAADVRIQLTKFAKMLTGKRGRVFAAFVTASQNDPEMATAFRQMWIVPRRTEAKLRLEKHRKAGRLRREVDLDVALDLLYGPMYYRLLIRHAPISPQFAEAVAEAALSGLTQLTD